MANVFISYSSKDYERATKIREWCEEKGLEPFEFSHHEVGLKIGKWQQQLNDQIRTSDLLIVIYSDNWVESEVCRKEFFLAVSDNVPVAPFVDSGTKSDVKLAELREQQIVEAFHVNEDGSVELNVQELTRVEDRARRIFRSAMEYDWPPVIENGQNLSLPDNVTHRWRTPFPGFRSLEIDETGIYFGRDDELRSFLSLMRRNAAQQKSGIVAIHGASGAGKSSFLKAGLVQRLTEQSNRFHVMPLIRPQSSAIEDQAMGLEASLRKFFDVTDFTLQLGLEVYLDPEKDLGAELAVQMREAVAYSVRNQILRGEGDFEFQSTQPLIVIPIDQTEEIFQNSNEEATAFLKIVGEMLRADQGIVCVSTVREDFLAQLQAVGLGGFFHPFALSPVIDYDDIIRGPLKRTSKGIHFENQLVSELKKQMLGPGNSLPLFAFILDELFRRFSKNQAVTLQDYNKLGGLSGAFNQAVGRASELLVERVKSKGRGSYNESQLDELIGRFIVSRLVTIDELGRRRSRQVSSAELQNSEINLDIAEALTDSRLVSSNRGLESDGVDTSKQLYELAHESMIKNWDWLDQWLEQGESQLKVLQKMRVNEERWRASGKDTKYAELTTIDYEELSQLVDPPSKSNIEVPEGVDEFFAAARNLKRKSDSSAWKRLAMYAAIFIVLFASFLTIGGVGYAAVDYMDRARLADYRLAVNYAKAGENQKTRLHAGWFYTAYESGIREQLSGIIRPYTFENEELNDRLEKTIRSMPTSMRSGLGPAVPSSDRPVWLSDGVFYSRTISSDFRIWDLFNGDPMAGEISQDPFAQSNRQVLLAYSAFENDGVLVRRIAGLGPISPNRSRNELVTGDVSTGVTRTIPPPYHRGAINSAIFIEDGTVLLTGSSDQYIRQWSTETGEPLARYTHPDREAITHVGTLRTPVDPAAITAVGRNDVAAVWGPSASLTPLFKFSLRRQAFPETELEEIVFLPSGSGILSRVGNLIFIHAIQSISNDETSDQEYVKVVTFSGHEHDVSRVFSNQAGDELVSADVSGRKLLWSLQNSDFSVDLGIPDVELEGLSFADNGASITGWSRDGTVYLWDIQRDQGSAKSALLISRLRLAGDRRVIWADGRGEHWRYIASGQDGISEIQTLYPSNDTPSSSVSLNDIEWELVAEDTREKL